jgi:hypothetical protein
VSGYLKPKPQGVAETVKITNRLQCEKLHYCTAAFAGRPPCTEML